MSFEWHGDEYMARLHRHLEGNLTAAAIHLTNRIVTVIGVDGREDGPSDPWTPPRKQRGDLRRSIGYSQPAALRRHVGSGKGDGNADPGYAIYLEFGTRKMLPRPYLRPTLYKERDQIRKLILVPMK